MLTLWESRSTMRSGANAGRGRADALPRHLHNRIPGNAAAGKEPRMKFTERDKRIFLTAFVPAFASSFFICLILGLSLLLSGR